MKTNIFLLILKIILWWYTLSSNTLWPPVSRSIDPFRTNSQASGNYTFHIQTVTPIYQNPQLKITFPSIYKTILSDSKNCKCYIIQIYQNYEDNFDCIWQNNSVLINWSTKWNELLAGLIEVKINNVINPNNSIGENTGNFEVETWSGLNLVIDSNMNFGNLGFSNNINKKNNINISNDGSDIANYITNYIIDFHIDKDYSPGIWFRIKLPDSIKLNKNDKIECYIIETNDILNCSFKDQYISTSSIKILLANNQRWKLKILNIRNPNSSTPNLGNFLFESLYNGVNTVIDQWENINGFSISAGSITDASVKGFPLVRNLWSDYEIRFRTSNFIPNTGAIKIVFPNDYNQLSGYCQVKEGLVSININSKLNCIIINTREIKITNFKDFNPNYITIVIKAINPVNGGRTGLFKVYSYSDDSMTKLIDKNENIGTVIISSISKTIFSKIDFYKKIFNCTFEENCKLDLRLFPLPGNNLPKSTTLSSFGQIDIQIPIFWWMDFQTTPECSIGSDPSAECYQREHIFSVKTKQNADYDYCEEPISISRITLPSIPGKFPFRVLTFRNGGKWRVNSNLFTVPLEQDTFIMDIPHKSISVLQVFASSNNNGDTDNLIHLKGNIQPFIFSNEGAINLIFSHTEDSLSNRAAWPIRLGVVGATDNSSIEIPCKVYINSIRAGYRAQFPENHDKIRCYMFTGDSNLKEDTYIQILGFHSNLILGDYFEIFLTNITFCTTQNRKCKLTISYTLTQNYKDPYILNKSQVELGTVQTAPPSFPTTLTGSITLTNNEICSPTELRTTVNLTQDLQIGDYFIITREISLWYEDFFRFDNYRVTVQGTTITGYPVLNKGKDMEQIIFKVTQIINSGSNKLFILHDLFTSPFKNTQAKIKVDFWSNKLKILSGFLPLSSAAIDGGILDVTYSNKDASNNRNNYFIRNYKQPFWIQFRNCQNVLANGEIIITFPTNNLISQFTSITNNCQPWYGINYQKRNITDAYCQFDTANERFIIKSFDLIPARTLLSFNFYAVLNNNFSNIRYDIKIYNNTSTPSSLNNFMNTTPSIPGQTINQNLPAISKSLGFKTYNWEMYQNHRGSITIIFETFNNINYEITESNYLELVFSKKISNPTEHIECRYGLEAANSPSYPSVSCIITDENADYYKLTIKLHPSLNINNTDRYKLYLTTKHDNINEGFQFRDSGYYIFSLYIVIGSTRSRIGNKRVTIFGPKIDHFYIWSSNKVLNDFTQISLFAEKLGSNFQFLESNLDNTNYDSIFIFFETNNGFAIDLGTSLPHNSIFPCRVDGLIPLTNLSQIQCKIFHGFNRSPAKIQISGFQSANINNFRIDLPLLKNPNHLNKIPEIYMRVIRSSSGVKLFQHEGRYKHLNNTFSLNSAYGTFSTNTDTTAITVETTSSNTLAFINLPIITPLSLRENDIIIFKFPLFWPQSFTVTCSVINTKDCISITNADLNYHLLVVKINQNLGISSTLRVRTLSPSSILPNSLTNEIEQYIFKDTRLIRKNTFNNFGSITINNDNTLNLTILCNNSPIVGEDTVYTLRFNLNHGLLSQGFIEIYYYNYQLTSSPCTNSSNSLLKGEINCTNNYVINFKTGLMKINNFENIGRNEIIEIKVNLKNNAVDSSLPHQWRIKAYYKENATKNYLITDTGKVNIPTNCEVGTANPIDIYWYQFYHKRVRIRTGQRGPIRMRFQMINSYNDPFRDRFELFVPKTMTQGFGQAVITWFMREKDYTEEIIINTTTDPVYNVWFIYVPRPSGWLKNVYNEFEITTVNGKDDNNGFIMPANEINYAIHMYTRKYIAYDVDYYNHVYSFFQVFKTNFADFQSESYIINANYKNAVVLKVKPLTNIPIGSIIKIRFPSVAFYDSGKQVMFEDDAGTGLSNNQTIKCFIRSPQRIVVDCTLEKNNAPEAVPATFSFTTTFAINTNEILEVFFDGYNNPWKGNDEKHVEMVMEYWNGSTHMNTGVEYDFTCIDNASLNVMNNYELPTFSSNAVSSQGIEIFIKIISPEDINIYDSNNNAYEGWGDYIIIEFPSNYVLPFIMNTKIKMMCNGCGEFKDVEIASNNRWLIYNPLLRNISRNTEYTLFIVNINQAIFKQDTVNFKVYIVKKRKIIRTINYNNYTNLIPLSVTEQNITITPLSYTSILKNSYQKIRVIININSGLPTVTAGSTIKIEWPTNIVIEDNSCTVHKTTAFQNTINNDIHCETDNSNRTFIISNFNDLVSGNIIEIDMFIKTPDSNTLGELKGTAINNNLDNKIFWTFTKNIQDASNIIGFNDIKFNSLEKYNNDGLKININGILEFNLILPSNYNISTVFSLTLDNSIQFNFDSSIGNKQLKCLFNNYEAQMCDVISTGPIVINFLPPIEPTFNIYDNVKIKIYPDCTTDIDMGFKFTSSGKIPIEIGYSGVTLNNFVEILGSDFTESLVKVLFSQANYYNSLYFKIRLANDIPANGKIRVRIPLFLNDEKTEINTVENNMGEVYNKCRPISSNLKGNNSDYVKCIYSKDSNFNIYEFSNLNLITASSEVIFVIDNLFNNNYTDDKRIVDIVLDTLDNNYDFINSKVFKDVYSIVNQNHSNQNSGFNLNRNSKNKFGEVNINYSFQNVNLGGTVNENDYIVFKFPEKYNIIKNISDCGSPAGLYESWGRNVLFYPTTVFSGIKNFCFFGGVNPLDDFSDPVYVYVVRNRYFTNILSYPIQAHTNENLSVSLSTNFAYSGTIIEVKITIDTNITINLQSYIKLRYSNTYKLVYIKKIDGLKYGYNIVNNRVGSNEEILIQNIKNIYKKSVDGLIIIYAYINIPRNRNNFSTNIFIGDVVNLSNIKITGSATLNLTIPSSTQNCDVQTGIGKTSSSNTVTINTPYSSNSFAPIIFIENINTLTNCRDGVSTIPACAYSSNQITFPSITDPSKITFEFTNTSQEEKLINILIRLGSSNIVCSGFKYNVFDNTNYSSDFFNYLHHSITKSPEDFNSVFIDFDISQNIDLNNENNKLYLEIKGIDEDRMTINDGEFIPCSLEYNSVDIYNLDCVYYKSNNFYPTIIEIKTNTILTSGNTLKLNILRFLNDRVVNRHMIFNFLYFSISNNKSITCIICYSNKFLLLDQTSVQTTNNLTYTNDNIQGLSNFVFTFSQNIMNTEIIFTYLPFNQGNRNEKTTTAITALDGTNTSITSSYKNNKYLIESILNNDDTLKLNNVENPDGILTNQKIYNIVIDNKIIIRKLISNISSINVVKDLFTTKVITCEYYNTDIFKMIYTITFNIPIFLNYRSFIDIEFPTIFNSILIDEILLIDYTDITNVNNLNFEIINNTILRINKITKILNTGRLELKAILRFKLNTSGSNNGKIIIKQNSSNGNIGTLVDSGNITFSRTQNSNKPNIYKNRKYLNYYYQPKLNTKSRLSFTFNSKIEINGTYTLVLKKPSTYNYNIIEKLRCIFEDLSDNQRYFSDSCNYDTTNSRFLINKPKNLTISNNKYYKVEILRYGYNKDGLQIPSVSLDYEFNLQVIRTDNNTLMSIYPLIFEPVTDYLTLICPRVLLYNINRSNLAMLSLKLPSNTGSNLILELEFPNKYVKKNNQVSNGFTYNLGQTTLKSTMSIGCKSSVTLNLCRIIYGSGYLFRSSKFVIDINTGLSLNTVYNIDLYNFKNPLTTQEYPEVYIKGKIKSGNNYRILFGYKIERYIYTVNPPVTTISSRTMSPSATTLLGIASLYIDFRNSGSIIGNYNNFLLEHYDRLNTENSTYTNGESYPSFFNEILIKNSNNYTNNSNIRISNLYFDDGLSGTLLVNNFVFYQIKHRVLVEKLDQTPINFTFNDYPFTTYTTTFFNNYPNSYTGRKDYNNAHYRNVVTLALTFSFTLTKGTIRFKLKSKPDTWSNNLATQASFWTYNCFEINNLWGNNYVCRQVNDFEIHLTNFNTINSGTSLTFKFSISTYAFNEPGDYDYKICTDIYSDTEAPYNNILAEQNCGTAFLNNNLLSFTIYSLFDMTSFLRYSRIQANEKGQLYFKFLSKGIVRKDQDFIEVRLPQFNFDNIANPYDIFCKIDELLFQSCILNKTNKSIKMKMPTKTDVVNNKEYEIFIYPIRQSFLPGTNNFDLFQFPNQGEYDITMHAINDSNTQIYQTDKIKYKVIAQKFNTVYINVMRIERFRDSYIYCKLNMSSQIKAIPEGKIEIHIQTKDFLNEDLFEDNLGISSYVNGKEISIVDIDTDLNRVRSRNLKGFIFFGNRASKFPIIISIFSNTSLNINEEIEFYIELARIPLFLNLNIFRRTIGKLIGFDIYGYNLVNNNWIISSHDFRQVSFLKNDPPFRYYYINRVIWNPGNLVGEVSTFSYTLYSINIPIYSETNSNNSINRIIMRYVHGTDYHNETNPYVTILNTQLDKPNCTNFKVNVLPEYKGIELIPLTNYNINDSITISCNNFKNQNYILENGSHIAFYLIEDFSIKRAYVTNVKNIVSPNNLAFNDVTFLSSAPIVNSNEIYKIEILPKNIIHKTGEIHILIENGFTNKFNCEINKGVQGAICLIKTSTSLVTYLGRSFIPLEINTLTEDYIPSEHGRIEITIEMTNPSTAKDYKFHFISYHEPYTKYNDYSNNFGKIDEMEIKTINILNINPIKYFSINEITTWANDVCPFNNDTGVLQYEISFNSFDLSYTANDYIQIINHRLNSQTLDQHIYDTQRLNYFEFNNLKYINSEHFVDTNTMIEIKIPEEINLLRTQKVIISIDFRRFKRGMNQSGKPGKDHFYIKSKNHNTEIGIVEYDINPCQFVSENFIVSHWHANVDMHLEFRLQGKIQWNFDVNKKVRLQIIISNFNEIKQTQYLDGGQTAALTSANSIYKIGCNIINSLWGYQLVSVNRSKEYCELYKSTAHSWADPLVITINNWSSANFWSRDNQLRSMVGDIKNYIITNQNINSINKSDSNRNTHSHISIYSQSLGYDNIWYNTNYYHYFYQKFRFIRTTINVTTLKTSGLVVKAFNFNENYLDIRVTFPFSGRADLAFYDFFYPWNLLTRFEMTNSLTCLDSCNFMRDNIKRNSFYLFKNINNYQTMQRSFYHSPRYACSTEVIGYVTRDNTIVNIYSGTSIINKVIPRTMIIENDLRNSPRNTVVRYRLLMSTYDYHKSVKYIRFYLPAEYSTVGPHCIVKFGFKKIDEDRINENIKCRITTGNLEYSRSNTLVEFYDINHYSDLWRKTNYEFLHIFEFDLTNPTTSKWSSEIHVQTHDNWDHATSTYNTTVPRIQYETNIGDNKGRYWIGEDIPITNYLRVYRNRDSFEDRKAKIGEWGELSLRLYPGSIIPANMGRIEIQLSQKYEIPDGGQNICEVGHHNHIDLNGQFCNINNERKITVNTNKDYGLQSMCNLVRITTAFALNNNNGFRSPQSSSGTESQVTIWNDTQLLEYKNEESAPVPITLVSQQDLWISTECNEINCVAVLKLRFNAKEKIPSSYLLNPNDPNASNIKLGIINLKFNTLDKYTNASQGFIWDLGYSSLTGAEINIPCIAYNNIYNKPDDEIKCKLIKATSNNYYKPIEMVISNFQAIEKGTKNIEIHILDITWVQNNSNLGWIEFNVSKKNQLSTDLIFNTTRINLNAQNNFSIAWVNENNISNKPSFANNKVGSESNNFEMKFIINDSLIQNDLLELEIPTQFIIPKKENISAIIKSVRGGVEVLKSAKVIIYYKIRKIHFYLDFNIFGCNNTIPCNISLIISGIRNAAYAFTGTYNLRLRVISRKHEKLKIIYTNLPAPLVNNFNSVFLKVSSLFSRDINVNYEFNFVPSYVFTVNSIIEIKFNVNLFKHINKSFPKSNCNTNFNDLINGVCEIRENLVYIKLSKELIENYSAKITLTGIKNPDFIGILNNNDIVISVKNENNFKINEDNITPLVYLKPKNIDLIYLNIKLSSNFQTINSKYTFTLQNTNIVPKDGFINIEIPSNVYIYQKNNIEIEKIDSLFSKNILIYTSRFIRQPNNNLLIQIQINFEWPANQQLNIIVNNIINPNILKSDSFFVNTRYDNTLIDQSDRNDPSTYINYLVYNPKIIVWGSEFSPKNEGEIGNYQFILSSKEIITSGSFVNLIFPNNYDLKVSAYNINLICSSKKIKIGKCSSSNRILKVEIQEDIMQEKIFDLIINGIMNPNFGTNGFIDISIEKNNKILQFNNKVVNFKTIKSAKVIEFIKLKNDNSFVLERSNYEICIRIVNSISISSAILIDFPEEFSLKSNTYNCTLADGHDNINFPFMVENGFLKCNVINELRRFNITGLSKSFIGISNTDPGYNNKSKFNLCFKLFDIENSLIDRITHSFSVSINDIVRNEIIYKTSENLNNISTKKFFNFGFKIYIDKIENIILGIYSNKIKIQLEKLVPYNIKLTPKCEGFLFRPEIIEFKFWEGTIQYFQIYTKTNNLKPGIYNIQWIKQEITNNNFRFSEINDTSFNLIEKPVLGELIIYLNKNVFKVPVNGTSLPVVINLNKPSNEDINIYFKTIKPQQNQFIQFSSQSILIKAGETLSSFTFKCWEGSISGIIELIIDPKFNNIYSFENKYINMELIDVDKKPPFIINSWELHKSSNSIKIRQSVNENSIVYYILTIDGALKPTKNEMKDKKLRNKSKNKPNFNEIQGFKYVNITKASNTFDYNNIYLEFNNLNHDSKYLLFTLPIDLSNNSGEVFNFRFKTKQLDNEVKFKLKVNQNISNEKLISGLSLVTGMPYERFEILHRPDFSTIQNNEIEVINSLKNSSLGFDIKIKRNFTNNDISSFEIARIINNNMDIWFEEIPELNKNNKIEDSLAEIFDKKQNFTYDPFLVKVTNYYAVFNVSIKYSGNAYGVVLYKDDDIPNSEQIILGMNANSIKVDENSSKNKFIFVDEKIQYKILPSKLLNFTNLLHSTNYTVYFIGDLYNVQKPLKMKDKDIKKISFKTKIERLYIDPGYMPLNIN